MNTGDARSNPKAHGLRIAIAGGTDYVDTAFEDFLYALSEKYPDCIIHAGTAGGKNIYDDPPAPAKKTKIGYLKSAEMMAASIMPGLGHEVWTPDMTTMTAQYLGGGSDLQLGWVLSGQWEMYRNEKGGPLHHRFITPRPDVIVAVGKIKSTRAATAYDHWKKFDAWRLEEFRRPFHNVAAPVEAKAAKKYRAKKKMNQTEQIAA